MTFSEKGTLDLEVHSICHTELPGLKLHSCKVVSVKSEKITMWTNSEIGKYMSIGMRVPKPRMFTYAND